MPSDAAADTAELEGETSMQMRQARTRRLMQAGVARGAAALCLSTTPIPEGCEEDAMSDSMSDPRSARSSRSTLFSVPDAYDAASERAAAFSALTAARPAADDPLASWRTRPGRGV